MDQIDNLKKWFLNTKRELPWRNEISPYAVWVSEIMLQQTQVSVVIPYFERWMRLFPTIEALAKSPVESVIKAWEGLGYYSRARNLHEGAQYVVKNFNGILPNDANSLERIKGIGSYTVGAILSFAFHQRAPAIDGNVLRVISRCFALNEDICQSKTKKKISRLVEEFLPMDEPWVVMESLIELGATVCTKKPKCSDCPIRKSCQAYIQGAQDVYPVKSANKKIEKLYRLAAIVVLPNGHLLVKKVSEGKIMAGLHEFPYFDLPSNEIDEKCALQITEHKLNLKLSFKHQFPQIKHSFTHYSATLFPFYFESEVLKDFDEYCWMSPEELKFVAFSSGHRQIYAALKSMIII